MPLSPGGSYQSPPIYEVQEINAAHFGVFLDPELSGQQIDSYLVDRALLCSADYIVELFAVADERALPAEPLVRLELDSGYVFDAALLQPGGLYAWRVIAQIDNRSTVAGIPLYFRLAPQPREIPPGLSLEGQAVAAGLQRAACEQRRAGTAVALSLAGLQQFDTYPTATDSYVCTPLLEEHSAPLPSQLRPATVSLELLKRLGAVLAHVQGARLLLEAEVDAAVELAAVREKVLELARSVTYGPQISRADSDLAALAARLESEAGSDGKLRLLSQLELAIDALVGPGTLNLRQDYQQNFMSYAAVAEQHLRRATELQPYFNGLDATAGLEWATLLEQQRAALLLLREEVGRGRLARAQLRQRIGHNRDRLAAELAAVELPLLEGATCMVSADRARTDDGALLKRLELQVVHCRLNALLAALWPEL